VGIAFFARPITPQPSSNGRMQRRFGASEASVDDGPNAELSPTTLLGEDIADAHRLALFVRRFRRGRGEFLEARIIPQRIEHWIEPEQRGSKRQAKSQWASVRDRE
jgi:hypothetical protein